MSLLTFVFKQNSGVPLYKQLYDFIRNEIRSGNLNAGEKLPSKRMLSSHLKISLNTVETAYQQLIAEGYIESIPKSGYFVCKLDNLKPLPFIHHPLEIAVSRLPQKQYKYDFKTNTVDTAFFPFATWARLSKEIMQESSTELLQASHPQGDLPLRDAVARYLHEFRGVHCDPDQIIIGAGTEYLLGLIIQILGQNQQYAMENPGYFKTYKIFGSNGIKASLIGLDESGIKPDELQKSGAAVVYITPSHHFPLGITMPINRRMQLLNWANQGQERYIIEDDYDSEFRFVGRPIPALQGLDTNDKVIYISTFSKSIAPSIRVSFMVLPLRLLKIYRNEFMFYSSTVSRFEQATLCKFIKNGHFERHLNRMRNIYRIRKDKLVEEIRKSYYGGRIDIIGENAGLHLLLRVYADLNEKQLIARAEEAGVKVYGLSDYYLQPEETMPSSTVVLGYANFGPDEIEKAAKLVIQAWFE